MQKTNDTPQDWDAYCKRELAAVTPILAQLGYRLEHSQPHLKGERQLTRPLGGAHKLLLLGRRASDEGRVVIKVSRERAGIAEMEHERMCRRVLDNIRFAYGTFLSPEELLFTKRSGWAILITAFIEARPFLERPVEEQFALALKAFKAQESAHATTASHVRLVRSTFGEVHAAAYVQKLKQYVRETQELVPKDEGVAALLGRTQPFFADHQETVEQYCGFLTHWDFIPQNIRVAGQDIYLLDHSSLHFGNKYEGWARFINFMTLYNPPLASALVAYVRDNRTPEESLSLKLMRLYRLTELVRYYSGWLPRTSGNLNALAQARITFWTQVLRAVLDEKEVPVKVIETYKQTRDSLRSADEKERQKGLH